MAPFRTWGIHGRVVMQTLVLYQLDLYPNHTISANAPNKCCPFSISENHAKVAPPRCRKAKSSETQIFKNVKKCPPSSFHKRKYSKTGPALLSQTKTVQNWPPPKRGVQNGLIHWHIVLLVFNGKGKRVTLMFIATLYGIYTFSRVSEPRHVSEASERAHILHMTHKQMHITQATSKTIPQTKMKNTTQSEVAIKPPQ